VNLVALLDELESAAEPYLTLDEAELAAGQDLSPLVDQGVLLVDHRQQLLPGGQLAPITLCRLNRHHPQVKALGGWD
jgi:hypothetical protein